MKKSILRVMAIALAMVLILAMFASCNQQGEQGPAGPQGEQGIQGEPGVNGTNGVDGKSAYELAVDKGYIGTVEEWLASLVGEVGAAGQAGANGQSAYEIAIKNGYTGTETEWLASLVGKDGATAAKGEDGKSAYQLAVENGYEGDLQSWLASLVGENGKDGANGKSAYEIAVANGYKGSEAEWLASLVGAKGDKGDTGAQGEPGEKGDKGDAGAQGSQGEKGDKGDAGRGIKRIWLDAELHLWVEYDDGSDPVDLGYVGVPTTEPTPTTYTVIFVDYNGTELKKETVESGKSATAPADPTRDGYFFIGWDKEFDNITSDLTVTATYEKTYTEPTFVVQSITTNAGDTVTVAINVKNNPGILAMTLSLTYDDNALDLISASNGTALSMLTMTSSKILSSGCKFAWDGVEIAEDDITDGEILVLTFVISDRATSGVYDIVISYTDGDIYDNDINILSFEIENGTITVN